MTLISTFIAGVVSITAIQPAAIEGSAEASEALMGPIIRDVCMPTIFGADFDPAATALGLEEVDNYLLTRPDAPGDFPDTGFSHPDAPRLLVIPRLSEASRRCTLAINDGDPATMLEAMHREVMAAMEGRAEPLDNLGTPTPQSVELYMYDKAWFDGKFAYGYLITLDAYIEYDVGETHAYRPTSAVEGFIVTLTALDIAAYDASQK